MITLTAAVKATPRAPSAFAAVVLAVGIVAFTFTSSAWASFGIETFENSIENQDHSPATQAGLHPYAMTTAITFSHEEVEESGEVLIRTDADPKNLEVNLPPGLIANPTATATRCTEAELENEGHCPDTAAVGVATINLTFNRPGKPSLGFAPVFNMVSPPGTPAEFGFNFEGLGIVVHILGNVRTGSDYGLSANVSNIIQKLPVYGTMLTLWGDPSDTTHDAERGHCAYRSTMEIEEEKTKIEKGEIKEGVCAVGKTSVPFLTLPSSCTGPLTATMSLSSWQEPERPLKRETTSPAMKGCEQLDFSPKLTVQPDTGMADSSSGLSIDLKVPQEESLTGLAEADLKDAAVTLPAGMAISPSAANGRGACTSEQIGLSNANKPSCPNDSKVGTVKIVTPLLEQPLEGAVYVAQPYENPFVGTPEHPGGSLLALYIVAEGSGALVKLAGHIEADPVTGQLTTRFEGNPPYDGLPQLPFSDLKMDLFGGARAPLVTPAACGTYEVKSTLTPWSGTAPLTPSEPFTITTGPGGGPCPNGGFAPSFDAGTTNNQAGAFSPFTMTLSRQDGEQRLASLQVQTPPGLLGVLKNVTQCPEPQASKGECPPSSQIGHTTVGAGPGPDQVFVPQAGRPEDPVYLTGPYGGAPFGLSIVEHAEAGPFNLGTVVTRARINIDPYTARLTVTSDPLPTILQGIPLDVRTINVTVDHSGFTFNPTNCTPMAVSGTIASTGGASAAVSNSFQAANCGLLPFKPKFTVATKAKTSKLNGASLHVKVTSGPGQANIGKVLVQLPKRLPSRLATLHKACLDTTFNVNPAACSGESVVGTATATTPLLAHVLTGPAYLVSHGGAAFPDLVIVLQGEGITLDLDGQTNVKKGITTSKFNTLPDAPVNTFDLELPQGPHSILAANGNLCSKPLKMPTTITGQNGAQVKQTTKIAVSGCPKHKRHKKK